jgi:hypothetical protein
MDFSRGNLGRLSSIRTGPVLVGVGVRKHNLGFGEKGRGVHRGHPDKQEKNNTGHDAYGNQGVKTTSASTTIPPPSSLGPFGADNNHNKNEDEKKQKTRDAMDGRRRYQTNDQG